MLLKISQNSQENTCARVSFLIKLQTLAKIFFCESCETPSLQNSFGRLLLNYLKQFKSLIVIGIKLSNKSLELKKRHKIIELQILHWKFQKKNKLTSRDDYNILQPHIFLYLTLPGSQNVREYSF